LTLAKPTRRRLHRLRLGLEALIAAVVIFAALVVGGMGIALPWLVKNPERVQAFLAARLGRPVTFERVEGHWRASGPVFALHGVKLGDGTPFVVESAELALDFYAGLKPDVSFSEFRIVGVAVDAVREPGGTWRITQFGDANSAGGARFETFGLGNFSLRDARLSLTDLETGATLRYAKLDLRFVDDLGERRFGGNLSVASDSAPIRFACALAHGGTGRCHIAGERVEPARWLADYPIGGVAPVRGEVDVALWVDLEAGHVRRARAELATRALALRGAVPVPIGRGETETVEPRHAPTDFVGAARFARAVDGWRLDVVEDVASGHASTLAIVAEGEGAERRYAINAPRVELARAAPLVALTSRTPPKVRAFVYQSAPRGTLTGLHATWHGGEYTIEARAHELALDAAGDSPGFGQISGGILGDTGAIVLVADPEQPLRYDHARVFRTPLVGTLNGATFAAVRTESGWRVEASEFDLDGEGYGATGSAALVFDGLGRRPFLDARVVMKPGVHVPSAKQFWPINVMPPKTVRWLDRALVSGVLLDGEAIVRGDLDDWPFKHRQGRFEARGTLAAATIDYHRDWPHARVESADVTFIDHGMDVRMNAGEVLGNRVTDARARIASFRDALLELDIEGEGSGEDLLRLLRASPVARRYGTHLIGLNVGGRGEIGLELDIPLKDQADDFALDGRVRLVDADLADAKYAFTLSGANGVVRFGRDGFAADDLAARLGGDPVHFGIAVGGYTSDPARLAEASLRGELPVSAVLAELDALVPLHARMPGRSDWTLELAVPRDEGPKRLSLKSDLVGTRLELPPPFRKDASTPFPVAIDLELPMLGGRIDLALGSIAKARVALPGPERELAADIAFGPDDVHDPPEGMIRLHGDIAELDLGGWGGFAGGGLAGSPIEADLSLGGLTIGGRRFADVELAFDQTATQHVAVLAGTTIAGRVVVPRGDIKLGVTAEFERLYVPEPAEGVEAAALDPARMPGIHFWAKDFRLGAAAFGEARFEAVPFSQGLRFDLVETTSPNVEMRARGEWTRIGRDERSRFEIDFTAESLGRMLDALGYNGKIEGGQTYARLAGSWPGTPTRFSLAAVDGTLEGKVGKGRILDVQPGAGRLFGLLSLQALPRRLTLDFSDFFKSGLAFDSIVGTFALHDGNAHTDDLVLKGPAAEIRIVGRTGLRVRDYDQRLEVTPRVGGVLPVVGALAAGPAGVAAGLVANILPLGQVARAEYKVEGSWDKPEITLIEKQRRAQRG